MKKKTAEKLVTNNRAEFVAEANFETDGSVYLIATMLIRRIVDKFNLKMNLGAKEALRRLAARFAKSWTPGAGQGS